MTDTMEDVERVRMALAEAGYPDVYVGLGCPCGLASCSIPSDEVCVDRPCVVPPRVAWMAYYVTGLVRACWDCWSSSSDPDNCDHPITPQRAESPA